MTTQINSQNDLFTTNEIPKISSLLSPLTTYQDQYGIGNTYSSINSTSELEEPEPDPEFESELEIIPHQQTVNEQKDYINGCLKYNDKKSNKNFLIIKKNESKTQPVDENFSGDSNNSDNHWNNISNRQLLSIKDETINLYNPSIKQSLDNLTNTSTTNLHSFNTNFAPIDHLNLSVNNYAQLSLNHLVQNQLYTSYQPIVTSNLNSLHQSSLKSPLNTVVHQTNSFEPQNLFITQLRENSKRLPMNAKLQSNNTSNTNTNLDTFSANQPVVNEADKKLSFSRNIQKSFHLSLDNRKPKCFEKNKDKPRQSVARRPVSSGYSSNYSGDNSKTNANTRPHSSTLFGTGDISDGESVNLSGNKIYHKNSASSSKTKYFKQKESNLQSKNENFHSQVKDKRAISRAEAERQHAVKLAHLLASEQALLLARQKVTERRNLKLLELRTQLRLKQKKAEERRKAMEKAEQQRLLKLAENHRLSHSNSNQLNSQLKHEQQQQQQQQQQQRLQSKKIHCDNINRLNSTSYANYLLTNHPMGFGSRCPRFVCLTSKEWIDLQLVANNNYTGVTSMNSSHFSNQNFMCNKNQSNCSYDYDYYPHEKQKTMLMIDKNNKKFYKVHSLDRSYINLNTNNNSSSNNNDNTNKETDNGELGAIYDDSDYEDDNTSNYNKSLTSKLNKSKYLNKHNKQNMINSLSQSNWSLIKLNKNTYNKQPKSSLQSDLSEETLTDYANTYSISKTSSDHNSVSTNSLNQEFSTTYKNTTNCSNVSHFNNSITIKRMNKPMNYLNRSRPVINTNVTNKYKPQKSTKSSRSLSCATKCSINRDRFDSGKSTTQLIIDKSKLNSKSVRNKSPVLSIHSPSHKTNRTNLRQIDKRSKSSHLPITNSNVPSLTKNKNIHSTQNSKTKNSQIKTHKLNKLVQNRDDVNHHPQHHRDMKDSSDNIEKSYKIRMQTQRRIEREKMNLTQTDQNEKNILSSSENKNEQKEKLDEKGEKFNKSEISKEANINKEEKQLNKITNYLVDKIMRNAMISIQNEIIKSRNAFPSHTVSLNSLLLSEHYSGISHTNTALQNKSRPNILVTSTSLSATPPISSSSTSPPSSSSTASPKSPSIISSTSEQCNQINERITITNHVSSCDNQDNIQSVIIGINQDIIDNLSIEKSEKKQENEHLSDKSSEKLNQTTLNADNCPQINTKLFLSSEQELVEREERRKRLEDIMSRVKSVPKDVNGVKSKLDSANSSLTNHHISSDSQGDLKAVNGSFNDEYNSGEKLSTMKNDTNHQSEDIINKNIENYLSIGQSKSNEIFDLLKSTNENDEENCIKRDTSFKNDFEQERLNRFMSPFGRATTNRSSIVANMLASGRLDRKSRAAAVLLKMIEKSQQQQFQRQQLLDLDPNKNKAVIEGQQYEENFTLNEDRSNVSFQQNNQTGQEQNQIESQN